MRRLLLLAICFLVSGCISAGQDFSAMLQGEWVSLDDPKSKITFEENIKKDFYEDELMSSGSFVIESFGSETYLVVSEDDGVFKYSIPELTEKDLSLMYLQRGNTLRYVRE